MHEDALPCLKATMLEQSLPRGKARDGQTGTHREVDVALNRTGFIGGPIQREDGTHGTTQQVFPGAA